MGGRASPSMQLAVVLILLGWFGTVEAQTCSTTCESEFINNCWPSKCNVAGATGQSAYVACLGELRNGMGPMSSKCSGQTSCVLTSAMEATASNTCLTSSSGTNSNNPPTDPNTGGGSSTTATMCDSAVTITGTPTTPTLCTASSASPLVYTFWPMTGQYAGTQRFFSVMNLPSSVPTGGPQPVMIMVNGYGGDSKVSGSATAQRYGITLLQITSSLDDGAGGFSLEFGNNGIANDANPMPCSASDSRDRQFLIEVFAWIESQSAVLDTSRVFAKGFSQNSMFAAYMSVCFADKVAGLWQGGSGLALTGYTPVVPGGQAQCSLSDSLSLGPGDCCDTNFCTTCKYWPLYPQTCASTQPERKLVDCLMMYTDDGICGSEYYMYQAMAREGNDARMLSFVGSNPVNGQGHTDPANAWSWVAGCLGLSEACTPACETAFVSTCMSDTASTTQFATCETQLHAGSLSGCTPGCSPTLNMLLMSETPTVSLSEGKFGTSTGLTVTTGPNAPRPGCNFGTFADVPSTTCTPPSTVALPDTTVFPPDTCGAAVDNSTASPATGSGSGSGSGGTNDCKHIQVTTPDTYHQWVNVDGTYRFAASGNYWSREDGQYHINCCGISNTWHIWSSITQGCSWFVSLAHGGCDVDALLSSGRYSLTTDASQHWTSLTGAIAVCNSAGGSGSGTGSGAATACPTDMYVCSDGSMLSRIPPSCDFDLTLCPSPCVPVCKTSGLTNFCYYQSDCRSGLSSSGSYSHFGWWYGSFSSAECGGVPECSGCDSSTCTASPDTGVGTGTGGTFCAQDTQLCPDGVTQISRTGPDCQFEMTQCPATGSGTGSGGSLCCESWGPPPASAHMVACGNPSNSNCEDTRSALDSELHEVRCCADRDLGNVPDPTAAWIQQSGCSVWAESNVDPDNPGTGTASHMCLHNANYSHAQFVCQRIGARLCTVDELEGGCTRATGCQHDSDMIWSQTAFAPSVQSSIPSTYTRGMCDPSTWIPGGGHRQHVLPCYETVCPQDTYRCPDGTPIVGHTGVCPTGSIPGGDYLGQHVLPCYETVCPEDTYRCPDGTQIGRMVQRNCTFDYSSCAGWCGECWAMETPSLLGTAEDSSQSNDGFTRLTAAQAVDVFVGKDSTSKYAVVASMEDNSNEPQGGLQVILLGPNGTLVAVGSARRGTGGFSELRAPSAIKTFVGPKGAPYAMVLCTWCNGGMQIVDLSDPTAPVAASSVNLAVPDASPYPKPKGVDTFSGSDGSSLYAIVTYSASAQDFGAVEIVNITDPYNPIPGVSILQSAGSGQWDVSTFTGSDGPYAIVTSPDSSYGAVRTLDLSDPTSVVPTALLSDGTSAFNPDVSGWDMSRVATRISGATGVKAFVGLDGRNYAIVTSGSRRGRQSSSTDDGITIIDCSDTSNLRVVFSATPATPGFERVNGAMAVDVITDTNGAPYAIITANADSNSPYSNSGNSNNNAAALVLALLDPAAPILVGSVISSSLYTATPGGVKMYVGEDGGAYAISVGAYPFWVQVLRLSEYAPPGSNPGGLCCESWGHWFNGTSMANGPSSFTPGPCVQNSLVGGGQREHTVPCDSVQQGCPAGSMPVYAGENGLPSNGVIVHPDIPAGGFVNVSCEQVYPAGLVDGAITVGCSSGFGGYIAGVDCQSSGACATPPSGCENAESLCCSSSGVLSSCPSTCQAFASACCPSSPGTGDGSGTGTGSGVFCAADMYLCSDGVTYIGRTAPTCDFDLTFCPATGSGEGSGTGQGSMCCESWGHWYNASLPGVPVLGPSTYTPGMCPTMPTMTGGGQHQHMVSCEGLRGCPAGMINAAALGGPTGTNLMLSHPSIAPHGSFNISCDQMNRLDMEMGGSGDITLTCQPGFGVYASYVGCQFSPVAGTDCLAGAIAASTIDATSATQIAHPLIPLYGSYNASCTEVFPQYTGDITISCYPGNGAVVTGLNCEGGGGACSTPPTGCESAFSVCCGSGAAMPSCPSQCQSFASTCCPGIGSGSGTGNGVSFCPQDTMDCPDGVTHIGRSGPDCEFDRSLCLTHLDQLPCVWDTGDAGWGGSYGVRLGCSSTGSVMVGFYTDRSCSTMINGSNSGVHTSPYHRSDNTGPWGGSMMMCGRCPRPDEVWKSHDHGISGECSGGMEQDDLLNDVCIVNGRIIVGADDDNVQAVLQRYGSSAVDVAPAVCNNTAEAACCSASGPSVECPPECLPYIGCCPSNTCAPDGPPTCVENSTDPQSCADLEQILFDCSPTDVDYVFDFLECNYNKATPAEQANVTVRLHECDVFNSSSTGPGTGVVGPGVGSCYHWNDAPGVGVPYSSRATAPCPSGSQSCVAYVYTISTSFLGFTSNQTLSHGGCSPASCQAVYSSLLGGFTSSIMNFGCGQCNTDDCNNEDPASHSSGAGSGSGGTGWGTGGGADCPAGVVNTMAVGKSIAHSAMSAGESINVTCNVLYPQYTGDITITCNPGVGASISAMSCQGGSIFCPQDLYVCPDGITQVGRQGPNCTFDLTQCPGGSGGGTGQPGGMNCPAGAISASTLGGPATGLISHPFITYGKAVNVSCTQVFPQYSGMITIDCYMGSVAMVSGYDCAPSGACASPPSGCEGADSLCCSPNGTLPNCPAQCQTFARTCCPPTGVGGGAGSGGGSSSYQDCSGRILQPSDMQYVYSLMGDGVCNSGQSNVKNHLDDINLDCAVWGFDGGDCTSGDGGNGTDPFSQLPCDWDTGDAGWGGSYGVKLGCSHGVVMAGFYTDPSCSTVINGSDSGLHMSPYHRAGHVGPWGGSVMTCGMCPRPDQVFKSHTAGTPGSVVGVTGECAGGQPDQGGPLDGVCTLNGRVIVAHDDHNLAALTQLYANTGMLEIMPSGCNQTVEDACCGVSGPSTMCPPECLPYVGCCPGTGQGPNDNSSSTGQGSGSGGVVGPGVNSCYHWNDAPDVGVPFGSRATAACASGSQFCLSYSYSITVFGFTQTFSQGSCSPTSCQIVYSSLQSAMAHTNGLGFSCGQCNTDDCNNEDPDNHNPGSGSGSGSGWGTGGGMDCPAGSINASSILGSTATAVIAYPSMTAGASVNVKCDRVSPQYTGQITVTCYPTSGAMISAMNCQPDDPCSAGRPSGCDNAQSLCCSPDGLLPGCPPQCLNFATTCCPSSGSGSGSGGPLQPTPSFAGSGSGSGGPVHPTPSSAGSGSGSGGPLTPSPSFAGSGSGSGGPVHPTPSFAGSGSGSGGPLTPSPSFAGSGSGSGGALTPTPSFTGSGSGSGTSMGTGPGDGGSGTGSGTAEITESVAATATPSSSKGHSSSPSVTAGATEFPFLTATQSSTATVTASMSAAISASPSSSSIVITEAKVSGNVVLLISHTQADTPAVRQAFKLALALIAGNGIGERDIIIIGIFPVATKSTRAKSGSRIDFEIVKTFAGTNTTEATNVGNSIQSALVDSVDTNSTSGGAASFADVFNSELDSVDPTNTITINNDDLTLQTQVLVSVNSPGSAPEPDPTATTPPAQSGGGSSGSGSTTAIIGCGAGAVVVVGAALMVVSKRRKNSDQRAKFVPRKNSQVAPHLPLSTIDSWSTTPGKESSHSEYGATGGGSSTSSFKPIV